MKFKNIVTWIIITLISIALIITSILTINKDSNKKTEKILNNKNINKEELKRTIGFFCKNKKIKEKKIKYIILKNISLNFLIENKNIKVTKNEILDRILNFKEFNSERKFSFNLYDKFLKKYNINESSFQLILQNISKKNKFNELDNSKNKTYIKNLKNNYYFKNSFEKKKNINKYEIYENFKLNLFIKKYLDKLFIKNEIKFFRNNNFKFFKETFYLEKNKKIKRKLVIVKNKNKYSDIDKKKNLFEINTNYSSKELLINTFRSLVIIKSIDIKNKFDFNKSKFFYKNIYEKNFFDVINKKNFLKIKILYKNHNK